MFRKVFIACSILFFFCTIPAFATIGVGINNGKIIITEKLKPGAIYKLPNIIVFNTGTEVSDYELSIKYNEKQPEIKPDGSWFHFSPDHFTLPPHGTKSVTATLQLPLNAQPGNYFSYIDAHHLQSTAETETRQRNTKQAIFQSTAQA